MNFFKLRNHDWIITIIAVVLLAIGTLVIFATTVNSTSAATGQGNLTKQFIFIIVGVVVYFLISSLEASWLKTPPVLTILYVSTILLLLYVKLFGSTIAGTNRWIDLGFFSFQPAEYAKIVLILITAAVFTLEDKVIDQIPFLNIKSDRGKSKNTFGSSSSTLKDKLINSFADISSFNPYIAKYLLSAILALPFVILVFMQPALGNAIIICTIWLLLLFVVFPSQSKLSLLLLLFGGFILLFARSYNISNIENSISMSFAPDTTVYFGLGLLILVAIAAKVLSKINTLVLLLIPILAFFSLYSFVYSWNNVLPDYQKTRVTTFLEGPESDPTGSGYQVRQSKIAIGSGRLLGRGYLEGTQSGFNVLTQAYNDFAFAALSEQFGFIGGALVLFLYLFLVIRVLRIALKSTTVFGTLVCVGVASLILLHVFITVGMNLGKLPVTGIPLPLISYGGSSVFVIMISLGIVQSIGGSQKAIDIADDLMLTSRSLTL